MSEFLVDLVVFSCGTLPERFALVIENTNFLLTVNNVCVEEGSSAVEEICIAKVIELVEPFLG